MTTLSSSSPRHGSSPGTRRYNPGPGISERSRYFDCDYDSPLEHGQVSQDSATLIVPRHQGHGQRSSGSKLSAAQLVDSGHSQAARPSPSRHQPPRPQFDRFSRFNSKPAEDTDPDDRNKSDVGRNHSGRRRPIDPRDMDDDDDDDEWYIDEYKQQKELQMPSMTSSEDFGYNDARIGLDTGDGGRSPTAAARRMGHRPADSDSGGRTIHHGSSGWPAQTEVGSDTLSPSASDVHGNKSVTAARTPTSTKPGFGSSASTQRLASSAIRYESPNLEHSLHETSAPGSVERQLNSASFTRTPV